MSLVPVFEIGLWNAWILFVPIIFIYLIAVKVISVRESEEAGGFQLTKKETLDFLALFNMIFPSSSSKFFLETMEILFKLLIFLK